MYNAFVEPAFTKLTLPEDQWVEVKRELTYGEEQDMYASMRRQLGPNQTPVLDPILIGQCRMEAFIVAWSFQDPNGKPVRVTPAAIRQLFPHVARAIRDLLDVHAESVETARAEEKKDPATVSV
jgi:hypothetical protein